MSYQPQSSLCFCPLTSCILFTRFGTHPLQLFTELDFCYTIRLIKTITAKRVPLTCSLHQASSSFRFLTSPTYPNQDWKALKQRDFRHSRINSSTHTHQIKRFCFFWLLFYGLAVKIQFRLFSELLSLSGLGWRSSLAKPRKAAVALILSADVKRGHKNQMRVKQSRFISDGITHLPTE